MKQKSVDDQPKSNTKPDDGAARREFLRNSIYAAYVTPSITALPVEQASADKSIACDRMDNPNLWN